MPNCLFFLPPGRVEVRELKLASARAGEVLVEALYTGVSPGTELRCFAGQQAGAPETGFIPGYQFMGRVAECPDGSLQPGQLVFVGGTRQQELPCVWGGHASHAVARADSVFPLPEGTQPLQAAFAKLAAISCHGAKLAAVQPQERVAVVGLGPIGFFSAQYLAQAGHCVTAYDLSAARVAAATTAGIEAVRIGRDRSSAEQVAAEGPPDVIIDCTGVPALMTQLMAAGRDLPWAEYTDRGLRYVVQGSYPGDFSIPYETAFMKEATILFPRDQKPSDLREVLALMGQGRLGLPPAAVEVHDPANAQAAYAKLQAARDLPLSVAFKW